MLAWRAISRISLTGAIDRNVSRMLAGFHKSRRVELVCLAAQPVSQVESPNSSYRIHLALDRSQDRHDFDLVRTRGLNRLDDGVERLCRG